MAPKTIQFSIRRLILLTAVAAAILAFAIRINANGLSYALFGFYFIYLAIWAFFRGQQVVSGLRDFVYDRQNIVIRRKELDSEIASAKQKSKRV